MKIAVAAIIILQIANLAATFGADHLNRRRALATRCILYSIHNLGEAKACTDAFPQPEWPSGGGAS